VGSKIPFGQSFDQVIEANLASAKCALVLWTKTSAESRWVRPAGAVLHAALLRDGKQLATPAAACADWKHCQREQSDPDKTNWSISTMFAGPAPTEMIISLDPVSKTAEDPSFSSDRVSLKCSGF
jgi:hypothetical protein